MPGWYLKDGQFRIENTLKTMSDKKRQLGQYILGCGQESSSCRGTGGVGIDLKPRTHPMMATARSKGTSAEVGPASTMCRVAGGTTAPKLIRRRANACFAPMLKPLMPDGGDRLNDEQDGIFEVKSMVAPGMLQSPSVRKWLGGIEPAWTLLDIDSFLQLRNPPSPNGGAIQLSADLMEDEFQISAITKNTLTFLEVASETSGLKLTATGNLSRAVVAEMCEIFDWPDFNKDDQFRLNKVINEPDFLPLFFMRHIAQFAKLVHRRKGYMKLTTAGRSTLEHQEALQAVLFHTAFWNMDLGDLGRGLHSGWPQGDIGIVLWSLSVAANDWQTRENLTRLCAVPNNGVLNSTWDTGSMAMEANILRPLLWFGMLEHKQEEIEGDTLNRRNFYRKSLLFDRFCRFNVILEGADFHRH